MQLIGRTNTGRTSLHEAQRRLGREEMKRGVKVAIKY